MLSILRRFFYLIWDFTLTIWHVFACSWDKPLRPYFGSWDDSAHFGIVTSLPYIADTLQTAPFGLAQTSNQWPNKPAKVSIYHMVQAKFFICFGVLCKIWAQNLCNDFCKCVKRLKWWPDHYFARLLLQTNVRQIHLSILNVFCINLIFLLFYLVYLFLTKFLFVKKCFSIYFFQLWLTIPSNNHKMGCMFINSLLYMGRLPMTALCYAQKLSQRASVFVWNTLLRPMHRDETVFVTMDNQNFDLNNNISVQIIQLRK